MYIWMIGYSRYSTSAIILDFLSVVDRVSLELFCIYTMCKQIKNAENREEGSGLTASISTAAVQALWHVLHLWNLCMRTSISPATSVSTKLQQEATVRTENKHTSFNVRSQS